MKMKIIYLLLCTYVAGYRYHKPRLKTEFDGNTDNMEPDGDFYYKEVYHDSAADCLQNVCPTGKYIYQERPWKEGTAYDAGVIQDDTGNYPYQYVSDGTYFGSNTVTDVYTNEYYSSGVESESCQECALGKYTSSTDALSCSVCGPDMYQPNTGQVGCILCSPGSTSTDPTQCILCPTGKYSTNSGDGCSYCGLSGTNPNKQSQASSSTHVYTNTGAPYCVTCAAGKGNLDGGVCDDCPAGEYSDSGTCVNCGLSGTNPNKQSQASSSAHVYTNTGAPYCVTCPAGKGNLDGGVCDDCSMGMYSDFGTCVDCPAGLYQDVGGSSGCKICDQGKYSNPGWTFGCTSCSSGKGTRLTSDYSGTNVPQSQKTYGNLAAGASACQDCGPYVGNYLNGIGDTSDITNCVQHTIPTHYRTYQTDGYAGNDCAVWDELSGYTYQRSKNSNGQWCSCPGDSCASNTYSSGDVCKHNGGSTYTCTWVVVCPGCCTGWCWV